MTVNERHSRSPHSHAKPVLDRLYKEPEPGSPTPFATICDRSSIPRDLRPGLLEQLVGAGYVSSAGDRVRLHRGGEAVSHSTPHGCSERDPQPFARQTGSLVCGRQAGAGGLKLCRRWRGSCFSWPALPVRGVIRKQRGAPP